MISFQTRHARQGGAAFSLVEMVTVIAIVVILLTAGVNLVGGSGSRSRRAATDVLTGMVEQARTAAITSRAYVVLAVAEPGDLPTGDERCRLGMFKVADWEKPAGPVAGVLMRRWKTLETGVILNTGMIDGLENPLDVSELTITYNAAKPLSVKVHAIAFNPRGGLHFPAGSSPVVMRVAEGTYQGGSPVPYKRGGSEAVSENLLRIGRVNARSYRID